MKFKIYNGIIENNYVFTYLLSVVGILYFFVPFIFYLIDQSKLSQNKKTA